SGTGRPPLMGILASVSRGSMIDGLATELEAARDALRRADRTRTALAEITARLTILRQPSAVLQRTVEEAVRLLDAFGAGLGILAIFSTRPAAFGDEERGVFETLAHQASIALENARRIEEIDRSRVMLARRVDVERALREIGGRLAALRDPTELLQRIVDEAG